MSLMTPEQFEASLKEDETQGLHERQAGGQTSWKIKTPAPWWRPTRPAMPGPWTRRYKDIMTCYSPLIDEVVNRYTYVSASVEDLVKKAEAGTFTAEMLGTCIYRCVGYDAFHALAAPPGRWTGTWAPSIGRASWNSSRRCRKKTCPWPGR